MRFVFDTNILDLCCNPKTHKKYGGRIADKLNNDPTFHAIIPAIVVYELSRGYLLQIEVQHDPQKRSSFEQSLQHMIQLISDLGYSPLTREILEDAAQLWADCRKIGQPTTDDKRIDVDVIIAAEAKRESAQVLTTNGKHFARHGLTICSLDSL